MAKCLSCTSGPSSRRSTSIRRFVLASVLSIVSASPAAAQNYGADARSIGLGAIGSTRNVASKLAQPERPYRRIGLPFGLLFQVLPNRDVFFPDVVDDKVSASFDLFRAMEYGAGPLHYTFGRDDSGTGQSLVNDVLNDELNRDLNVYRGFQPATRLTAEGVGSPSWGFTFKRQQPGNPDSFHGVYVGAGPWASVTTETVTDQSLADFLGSASPVFAPNTIFGVSHETTGQAAAAITVGYHVSRPTGSPAADGRRGPGVYFVTNVSYLIGLYFGRVDTDITFETDAAGLIATDDESTVTPLVVNYLSAKSGRGISVDTGAIYVKDRWEVGVGVNGIGNQMKWTSVELRQSIDESLTGSDDDGEDFDPVPAPDETVELPVNVSTNVTYHADRWSATGEYSRRFRGNNLQGGLEYLTGRFALRGGARYARDRWHPATGVGIDLTPRFGIDVALFGTSTNVERRRHATVAVSLRFNRGS